MAGLLLFIAGLVRLATTGLLLSLHCLIAVDVKPLNLKAPTSLGACLPQMRLGHGAESTHLHYAMSVMWATVILPVISGRPGAKRGNVQRVLT